MERSPNDLTNFGEEHYLRANPDVAQAVKSKQFSSGWEHAVLHGFAEHRPGLTQEAIDDILLYRRRLEVSTAYENPPPELRIRVHGEPDLASFYLKGSIIADNIDTEMNAHSIELPPNPNVLDFGCGCGRIISHLKKRHPGWNMTGSDIDQEAIQWCRQYLSDICDCRQNGVWPPLEHEDSKFDFIYAISVFTHLPDDMQFAWLKELGRVTKPGGALFLSTHNMNLLSNLRAEARSDEGFRYLSGESTPGLPDFYQNSYHTHDYIYSAWCNYLHVVSIVSKGVNGHQDLVICRKIS